MVSFLNCTFEEFNSEYAEKLCKLAMDSKYIIYRKRLSKIEKKDIQPNTFYVYDKNLIRRWTDSINWTPSRVSKRFLVYKSDRLIRKNISFNYLNLSVVAYFNNSISNYYNNISVNNNYNLNENNNIDYINNYNLDENNSLSSGKYINSLNISYLGDNYLEPLIDKTNIINYNNLYYNYLPTPPSTKTDQSIYELTEINYLKSNEDENKGGCDLSEDVYKAGTFSDVF